MKAVYAGVNIPDSNIRSYLYVCNRKAYELEFYIPCHSLSEVQVYVDLGANKPVSQGINLVNLCNNTSSQLIPDRYIIGKDADGNWYGVFTFADAAPPPLFAISLTLDTDVYFTEAYRYEPCDLLKKVSGCFPISRTDEFGFDCNGIYFGTSTDLGNSLGDVTLSYDHYAFVRRAKVFKDTPKLTFSSNLRRNFRTTVNRIYEFRCETVPDWYKEYLLAIYSRGFIKVDDDIYQVTDLSFSSVNDDDVTWKPYAKLQTVANFQFGCDDCLPIIPCCTPTIISVDQQTIAPAPPVLTGTVALYSIGSRQQCGQQASTQFQFTIANPQSVDVKIQIAYVYGTPPPCGSNNYSGAGGSILPDSNPDKSVASSLTPNTTEIIIPANTTNWRSANIQFPISGTSFFWDLISYPLCNSSFGNCYVARIYFKVISPGNGLVLNLTPVDALSPYNVKTGSVSLTQIM